MRTFIAIELPEEIKDALYHLQEKLKKSQADVKWVVPQNIHLTLKFLGEIKDGQFDEIASILEGVAEEKNTFTIRLSSIGAFPKINFPRVIWVGIDKGDNETEEIARMLQERLKQIGIPEEERPFSSHITVGRVRSALNKQRLAECLLDLQNKDGFLNQEFQVEKITIFKSTLTPKGPIYEVLKEANLKTI